MLRALVLAVVPTVLAGVPLALLRRDMAFRAVAMQGLVAALLAQAVAVVVALRGGGVWALVVAARRHPVGHRDTRLAARRVAALA